MNENPYEEMLQELEHRTDELVRVVKRVHSNSYIGSGIVSTLIGAGIMINGSIADKLESIGTPHLSQPPLSESDVIYAVGGLTIALGVSLFGKGVFDRYKSNESYRKK